MNAGASRSRATSAKRRVEEGLEALREGLAPYVDKHMRARHGAQWRQYASRGAYDGEAVGPLDVQALLKTMLGNWNDVFRHDARLRKARSFISLALEARNAAAHFAGDMEERAALRHLDAMRELLAAVGASDRESALAALYDEQREADDRPRATRHDAASDEPPLQRLPPRRNFRHSHANVSAPGGKYAPTAGTTLNNTPSRRGGTIRVLGEEMEYVYPMDAVHMILRRCQERDPNFLPDFYSHWRNQKRIRRFVARSTEELYKNTPYLRNYHKPLGDGWLWATYIGRREQKIILEIAAEVAGLTLGHDIVVDF